MPSKITTLSFIFLSLIALNYTKNSDEFLVELIFYIVIRYYVNIDILQNIIYIKIYF